MKLRTLFVVGLLASMFVTSGAGAASAVNIALLDCQAGYMAVSPNEDGSDANCVPEPALMNVEAEPAVDPVPPADCWVTSDGVNACARGGIDIDPSLLAEDCGTVSSSSSEAVEGSPVGPVEGFTDASVSVEAPAPGALVADGTADCLNPIAYNMMPMPALGAPEVQDKSAALASDSSGTNSNGLALAGLMVGLGGAAAIGLSLREHRRRSTDSE